MLRPPWPLLKPQAKPLCHEFVVAYQPPVFPILPTPRCLSLTEFQVCLVGEANADEPASQRRMVFLAGHKAHLRTSWIQACLTPPQQLIDSCRIITAAFLLCSYLPGPQTATTSPLQCAHCRTNILTHALPLHACRLAQCSHPRAERDTHARPPTHPPPPFRFAPYRSRSNKCFSRDAHGAPALTIPSGF